MNKQMGEERKEEREKHIWAFSSIILVFLSYSYAIIFPEYLFIILEKLAFVYVKFFTQGYAMSFRFLKSEVSKL